MPRPLSISLRIRQSPVSRAIAVMRLYSRVMTRAPAPIAQHAPKHAAHEHADELRVEQVDAHAEDPFGRDAEAREARVAHDRVKEQVVGVDEKAESRGRHRQSDGAIANLRLAICDRSCVVHADRLPAEPRIVEAGSRSG